MDVQIHFVSHFFIRKDYLLNFFSPKVKYIVPVKPIRTEICIKITITVNGKKKTLILKPHYLHKLSLSTDIILYQSYRRDFIYITSKQKYSFWEKMSDFKREAVILLWRQCWQHSSICYTYWDKPSTLIINNHTIS